MGLSPLGRGLPGLPLPLPLPMVRGRNGQLGPRPLADIKKPKENKACCYFRSWEPLWKLQKQQCDLSAARLLRSGDLFFMFYIIFMLFYDIGKQAKPMTH